MYRSFTILSKSQELGKIFCLEVVKNLPLCCYNPHQGIDRIGGQPATPNLDLQSVYFRELPRVN